MLTRVARNDVVRSVHTGEVGTVDGWADHARINGTIVDVRFSNTDIRPCGVANLEFVASAKPKMTGPRSFIVLAVFAATLAAGTLTSYDLTAYYGLPWYTATVLGMGEILLLWQVVYVAWLRPTKTRMTQPTQVTAVKGERGKSKPPVGN